jgi:CRP/FNR family transcriptional regulator, dissimilatory nitrate respiration regulator
MPTTGSELPATGMLDSGRMDASARLYPLVRQHYLFAGLAEEGFEALAAHMFEQQLGKGEVLFHRGDNADHFYFLESGQIELSLISAGGQKKVIEVVGHHRTFAEAVMFMREGNFPVTAEALTDSVLVRVENDAYRNVLNASPDACFRLLSDVCRHLHARVREIENLTIQNARSRLCSYLLDHVTDARGDEATVRLDLPRQVIASRLSVTPETLSRLLRQLVDEGILTVEDRIIFVRSLERLRPYD